MATIWNENKPTLSHGQMLFSHLLSRSNPQEQKDKILRVAATENGIETLRLAAQAGNAVIKSRIANANAVCERRLYDACGSDDEYHFALGTNILQREALIKNIEKLANVIQLIHEQVQLHDLEKVTGVSLRVG